MVIRTESAPTNRNDLTVYAHFPRYTLIALLHKHENARLVGVSVIKKASPEAGGNTYAISKATLQSPHTTFTSFVARMMAPHFGQTYLML